MTTIHKLYYQKRESAAGRSKNIKICVTSFMDDDVLMYIKRGTSQLIGQNLYALMSLSKSLGKNTVSYQKCIRLQRDILPTTRKVFYSLVIKGGSRKFLILTSS